MTESSISSKKDDTIKETESVEDFKSCIQCIAAAYVGCPFKLNSVACKVRRLQWAKK